MRIVLDHREKKIVALVTSVFPSVEIDTLPVGDLFIAINGHAIIVERKSVPDFVSSIRSNHLWEQLLSLLKTRSLWGYEIKRKLLVIHGDIEAYTLGCSWRFWSSLAGTFQEIIFVYGIPIVLVGNDDFFSQFLRVLIKREMKGSNEGLPKARWCQRKIKKDMPEKDSKMVLLDVLPGVGKVLAGNLLDRFVTVERIVTASLEELQTVEGIGQMKAKKIFDLFHK